MRVFVSYRRADASGHSGRLTDAVTARLGAGNVFQDVAGIGPGRDFQAEIDESLDLADTVLAVIGPGWLTAATPDGQRRLFQPSDFVRTELSRALHKNLRVVPVLVGGAPMPTADELPSDLVELTRRQAVVVRDDSFHADVDRLLRSLRGEPDAPLGSPSRRRPIIAVAVVLLIAAGAVTWWQRQQAAGFSSNRLTGCPATTTGTWTSIPLAAKPEATVPYDSGGTLTFTVTAANWRPVQPGQWQIVVSTQMENNATTSAYHHDGWYRSIRVAQRDKEVYCFDPTPENGQAVGSITDAHVGFNVECFPSGAVSLILQHSGNGRMELPFTAATTPASCTPGRA